MKTSKSLYFNLNVDSKTKLDTIKSLGYDEFFTGINDAKETLQFKEQLAYANKIGLQCTMVHCSYFSPSLNSIWLAGKAGDDVIDDYINQINMCGTLSKNFVVHLHGSKESVTSQIGIERIKRLLSACEKYNLNLCVENLYSDKEIPYIFQNLSHPLLKICYDSGHKNFFTPSFDLCEKYGKYIAVLHLHENDGNRDEHKKLSIGSPVFLKLKNEIKFIDKNVVLASESKCKEENWQEYLKEDLFAMKNLEK